MVINNYDLYILVPFHRPFLKRRHFINNKRRIEVKDTWKIHQMQR